MSKTVRVRIAVVVDETGNWTSIGYLKMPPDDRLMAADILDGAELRWFWIEADLPLPETAVAVAQRIEEIKEP